MLAIFRHINAVQSTFLKEQSTKTWLMPSHHTVSTIVRTYDFVCLLAAKSCIWWQNVWSKTTVQSSARSIGDDIHFSKSVGLGFMEKTRWRSIDNYFLYKWITTLRFCWMIVSVRSKWVPKRPAKSLDTEQGSVRISGICRQIF